MAFTSQQNFLLIALISERAHTPAAVCSGHTFCYECPTQSAITIAGRLENPHSFTGGSKFSPQDDTEHLHPHYTMPNLLSKHVR
ncbi:putative signal peptide protein [Puccinia sorghi]|uniref:Putative signal peptide protein n=1 Tax=Puccinia sorghi TaxID=27349 RepID=A0A0L6VD97_9BASI|nr:putative signal peptide protein [Puccinia sorghi]